MDQAEGSIGQSDYVIVTFKFGGQWVSVKNQTRKRYIDGRQRTMTFEMQNFSHSILRAAVMTLCSWDEGHFFNMHYHIPETSPKEYILLADDDDVDGIRRHSCRTTPAEIVVDAHNTLAEYNNEDFTIALDTFAQGEVRPFDSSTGLGDDTFLPGTHFSSAQAFKQALRTESIKTNCSIQITSSNKSRVLASCSYSGCQWKIRATLCSDGQTFEVRKLFGVHFCPGINRSGNKLATVEWVAEEIKEVVKQHPTIPPKEIKRRLEASYSLTLPYIKLWRSRELARGVVFGSVEDNYKYVPSLHAELLQRNPGSHITYMVESSSNSFKRFFVSFKVCIEGFIMGCRPLIGLDACHLKSKYLGVLISATTLDGNNGLYTLAFAVVEGESKSSWTWFLNNLYTAFGFEVYPLSFISDMEKGLLAAIRLVFPSAEHRVCIRHLWKNLVRQFKCQEGQKLHSLVWRAANTYKQAEHKKYLDEICYLSPEMNEYLMSLPYLWSRSQFSVHIKNDANTSNMAESFNAWISEARNKPVVDLVSSIRGMLMSQRATRKINASTWRTALVPTADDYIRDITTRKDQFMLTPASIFHCEVEGVNGIFEVDTQISECTCRFWQMTGLPCIHAVAFIATKQQPTWHNYVDEHYFVDRYKRAYDGAISTMPGKEEWEKVEAADVDVPISTRPRGRPKVKRLQSFLESSKGKSTNKHRCGRCGEWGHHHNRCKNPLS